MKLKAIFKGEKYMIAKGEKKDVYIVYRLPRVSKISELRRLILLVLTILEEALSSSYQK